MKKLKYLLALCTMFTIPIMGAGSTYAASDYDDVITSPSQLRLSYPGYNDMDITTSYMNYIMGSTTDGVAVNECDSSCKDIVNDSLDHGDWSINQVYSNYPGSNYSVQAFFCDQKIDSLSFYTNHYGSTTEKSIYGSTAVSANCASIIIRFQSVVNGGHIFIASTIYNNVTTNVITIADKWTSTSGGVSLSSQPFIYTGDFQLDEYEGEYPPSEYVPPTPPTTHYIGTVDCMSVDPVSVGILQDGNNGSATLTPLSFGRAEWSYDLTSEPYAVQVLCGDKLASSVMVSPSTTSGDWICNIYENPRTCGLS